jgi:hypothetical protein
VRIKPMVFPIFPVHSFAGVEEMGDETGAGSM